MLVPIHSRIYLSRARAVTVLEYVAIAHADLYNLLRIHGTPMSTMTVRMTMHTPIIITTRTTLIRTTSITYDTCSYDTNEPYNTYDQSPYDTNDQYNMYDLLRTIPMISTTCTDPTIQYDTNRSVHHVRPLLHTIPLRTISMAFHRMTRTRTIRANTHVIHLRTMIHHIIRLHTRITLDNFCRQADHLVRLCLPYLDHLRTLHQTKA